MKRKRGRADWLMAALCLVVFGLVTWVSNAENGLVASTIFGVFATLIITKAEAGRDDLRRPRFWLVLAVFALLHVVALAFIRIPELPFGLMVLPLALVDAFAMWGFLGWIERRFPDEGRSGRPRN